MGIEYNKNGEFIFEGEYKNNRKFNGKIKQYYINGTLKFDGELSNFSIKGKGKEYYDNGILKYEGDYLKDKWNGKGKEYHEDGSLKFEGEFESNFRLNGEGYYKNENRNIIYELKNGTGKSREYYNNRKLEYENI